MAHACNPSYSGGRDQEALSWKPAWANSLRDSISKKPTTKKGWWSSSSGKSACLENVRPISNPVLPKKKKKSYSIAE
jgi:hypothetical protein